LFNDPDLNKGLKIEINIPGQFSELIMLSDAKIISQVLTNLLSNAINYTSKGVVELGFDLHNELIEFYVKDTGIGIPYQEQQLIFETFYRGVYAISSAIRGTGLGLSISKKLVGLLNGKIGLTSTPNQGSRFYFTVPFIRGQQEDQKKSLLQPAPQNLKDISILIAEDEAINFQFLEVLLRGKVKKIDHAFNGKEAVEMAIKYNYNMILMDMKMPVMGGIEAIKILKLKFPDLPIIAQTAFVFPEDRENALQAGCDDFLSKPIKKEDLMVIITKYG